MAATTLPSTSQAWRKSRAMSGASFFPARGYLGQRERRGRIRRVWRAREAGAEEAAPPVLKSQPPAGMPLGVVAGADIRVRGAQVAIEQAAGEAGGAIVHVHVGLPFVGRDRDLDRRRARLLAIVEGIALVVDGVVVAPLEFLRAPEQFARVRRQPDVHPELAIACGAGSFALDRIDTLDQCEAVAEVLSGRVGQGRREQRVRHRVECRLGREAEEFIVER
jgi:hypothetical protein